MAFRLRAWKALPLWIIIVAGLSGLGAVLVTELKHRGTTAVHVSDFSNSDLVLTGVHVVTAVDGIAQWELNASRAQIFETNHQVRLEDVRGTARSSDNTVVRFEGQSGVFNTATRDVELRNSDGETVIQWSNGYVVRGEVFRWNQAAQEVTSDRPVSIAGPHVTMTGVGLQVRPASQELTLLSHVLTHVF